MTIGTRLYTLFHGKLVGHDALGNRYFTLKKAPKSGRSKRWVMYKGEVEPSRVPPEWHGWLHYTLDTPPTERKTSKHAWQKPAKANMSGTAEAYLPPGHLLKGGVRATATSDYQPWQPKS